MRLLNEIFENAEKYETIKAIILYGGKENSFSVGGDFNEVSNFEGGDEVEAWLNCVNNLYTTILKSSKSVIAAIDNYAIGFGLQLALTCDYRIGSDRCKISMPEFSMGIACNFGGYMLEKFFNRSVMQSMLFNCDHIDAEQSLNVGLIHELVQTKDLLSYSLEKAKKFASYPLVPVTETKQTLNNELIIGLAAICEKAKIAHKKVLPPILLKVI